MRNFITATKITILASVLFLAVGLVGVTPRHAAALTDAQKKSCQNQWAGKTVGSDSAKFKDFKNSNCNNGYCGFQLDEANGTVTISCPAKKTGGNNAANNECTDTTSKACSISDPALASGGCTGKGCSFIDAYINPAIKLLSVLVGVVAVIFIIFGAIQVSSSGGDPQKSANGKNHIRNALIGVVAYVLLFALINWLIPGGIG